MPTQPARTMAPPVSPMVWSWSLILCLALAATLFQAQQGALFSWDSDLYMIMADKFARLFSLDRLALYPPLYPITISLPQMLGFSVIQAVQAAWFVSFFLIAGCAYILSRSVIVAAMALLFVFATEVTALHFRFVWTEMGYAALLSLAISGLFIHISDPKNKTALFVFLIAFALLPVQRYIGGYMSLLLGLIFVGFSEDRAMFLRRVGMSLLSTIPTALLIVHNYMLSGHFAGSRPDSKFSFVQNAELAWTTLIQNFRGEMVLIVLTIQFAVILLFRRTHHRKLAVLLVLLAILPVAQIVFQIISSSLVHIDRINARYFIVLTPVVFLNVLIISSVWGRGSRQTLLIAATFALIVNVVLGRSNAYDHVTTQPPYRTAIQQFLEEFPIGEVAVYARNTRHLWADEILTNQIVPSSHCQSYQAIGDFKTSSAGFSPDCESKPGHTYRPVVSLAEAARYPVVLILPAAKYDNLVQGLHDLEYDLQRIDHVLIMNRVQN